MNPVNTGKRSVVEDCAGPRVKRKRRLCYPEYQANRRARTTGYVDIFPVLSKLPGFRGEFFSAAQCYCYLCRPEYLAGTKLYLFKDWHFADCCDLERLFEAVCQIRNSKKFRTSAGCSSWSTSWPAVGRGGRGGDYLCAKWEALLSLRGRWWPAAGSAQTRLPPALPFTDRPRRIHVFLRGPEKSPSTRASFCSQCLLKAATFSDVHAYNFLCIPSYTVALPDIGGFHLISTGTAAGGDDDSADLAHDLWALRGNFV